MEEKLVAQFLVALGFAPYAAIAGAAVALLDYLTWYFNKTSENTKDSWLGLKYEGQALQGLVVWTFGAGIAGFVDILAEILQQTVQAAVLIAVTWPLLMSQLSRLSRKNEPEQPDQSDNSNAPEVKR